MTVEAVVWPKTIIYIVILSSSSYNDVVLINSVMYYLRPRCIRMIVQIETQMSAKFGHDVCV